MRCHTCHCEASKHVRSSGDDLGQPHVCHLPRCPIPMLQLAATPAASLAFPPHLAAAGSGSTRFSSRNKNRGCSTDLPRPPRASSPRGGGSPGPDMSAGGGGSSAGLTKLAPLEAILFDIDGTLCNSDPFHFLAFRELLQQVGFNDGVPITEEFYSANISGCHNDALAGALFPELDHAKAMEFMDHKEALFRKLAAGKLKPLDGLQELCRWIEGRNLKRAAVTNAPRANAEFMLSLLGLTEFFPVLVIGSECERAKPSPDPYLKALELIDASPDHTFIFEDSASGIRAGVAAGVAVVGLTTGNPEKVLSDAGATLLIRDFQDPKLLSILAELEPAVADKQG